MPKKLLYFLCTVDFTFICIKGSNTNIKNIYLNFILIINISRKEIKQALNTQVCISAPVNLCYGVVRREI